MKTNLGFSLVEMMVAVAILAILSAIAIPSFNNMLASNRLATQTNSLIGDIAYARNEAIKRNQGVSLCRAASATATSCETGSAWTDWIVINTGGSVLRRGQLGSGSSSMTISSTLPGNQLTFAANGLATVTAGNDTITVCNSTLTTENRRVLTIGISGRVNLLHETGGC